MKIIKDLWWFSRQEKRRYLIGTISLSLVAVLNLIPPKVMGAVIDRVIAGDLTHPELLLNLLWLVLSAVAMYFLRYIWCMYIFGASYRLGQTVRSRPFDHFTKMSPSFYQKYRTGDLRAHATNDINVLTRLAGGGVMSAVDTTTTAMVTLITIFFTISWQMTLVAIVLLSFMAYTTGRLGRQTHKVFSQSQTAFSELNNKVQESVFGIKVTKSFGYQDDELQSLQETNEMTFKKNMTAMKYDIMFNPLVLLFIGASYVLTLFMGAIMAAAGHVTVGSLVTLITYLDMLVWPLMAIGFLFNMVQHGSVSYERIGQLLQQESDVKEAENPLLTIKNGRLVYDIDTPHYEDEETLADIHFAPEQDQTLGLVEQTGSGKTTLIRLLLREYDLQGGQITLDGHDTREYRLADLRRLIGYVPQDQFLSTTSILGNIHFGNPKSSLTQVEAAAKLARVYDDIVAMPNGSETMIGEKGVSLSDGQRQRITMSRTMILDPDILILDDPLSAVDAKTEHAIIENLKETWQNKSTIIMAHRLNAVVHADLILMLQDGHIIEHDRHEEFIEQGGWYVDTYEARQSEVEEDTDEE